MEEISFIRFFMSRIASFCFKMSPFPLDKPSHSEIIYFWDSGSILLS